MAFGAPAPSPSLLRQPANGGFALGAPPPASTPPPSRPRRGVRDPPPPASIGRPRSPSSCLPVPLFCSARSGSPALSDAFLLPVFRVPSAAQVTSSPSPCSFGVASDGGRFSLLFHFGEPRGGTAWPAAGVGPDTWMLASLLASPGGLLSAPGVPGASGPRGRGLRAPTRGRLMFWMVGRQ